MGTRFLAIPFAVTLACCAALPVYPGKTDTPQEPPFSFGPYGWTGTFNIVYTKEAHSPGATVQDDTSIKGTLAFKFHEDGGVDMTGAYTGSWTLTQVMGCLPYSGRYTQTDKQTYNSTLDDHLDNAFLVTAGGSEGKGGGVIPLVYFNVTVTKTHTSNCPLEKNTTTTTTERQTVRSPPFHAQLADPQVPKLQGTETFTSGNEQWVDKWDLSGCGMQLGLAWTTHFPPDNRLVALKQPFRGHVVNFVKALRAAGVNVDIISVYRPDPRVYLMHYAYRIGYGRGTGKYALIDPENVPPYGTDSSPYKTDDPVPICWKARDSSGQYRQNLSVALARAMVRQYNINVQHGPAYPSNHSGRKALDMNITWGMTPTVRTGCPAHMRNGKLVGDSVHCPAYMTLTGPSGNMNHQLWALGATYGVIKYTSPLDPQHWSFDGS